MYIIIYDFGTSAVKTCLFEVGDSVKLLSDASASYGISFLKNGGAEQDPEDLADFGNRR